MTHTLNGLSQFRIGCRIDYKVIAEEEKRMAVFEQVEKISC